MAVIHKLDNVSTSLVSAVLASRCKLRSATRTRLQTLQRKFTVAVWPEQLRQSATA